MPWIANHKGWSAIARDFHARIRPMHIHVMHRDAVFGDNSYIDIESIGIAVLELTDHD